jgi:hypothetical protein
MAGAAVGPELAQYVSAYALILVGWFAGLLYGLFTRSPNSKLPVWAYTLFTFLVTMVATVPVSQFAANYVPFSYTALLFPVAVAIPAMPDKWGTIGQWAIERFQAMRGVKP